MHFSRLLTIEPPSMAASDNILAEKQYVLFREILIPLEKPVYVYK